MYIRPRGRRAISNKVHIGPARHVPTNCIKKRKRALKNLGDETDLDDDKFDVMSKIRKSENQKKKEINVSSSM